MVTALAMVDATSAVATVNTARLASRMITDTGAMCILRPPSRCPMRRIFAAAAPNSGELFR